MTATREPAADPDTSVHGSAALRLVGADVEVPLVTGGIAPLREPRLCRQCAALGQCHDAVDELLHWYSQRPPRRGLKSQAVDGGL